MKLDLTPNCFHRRISHPGIGNWVAEKSMAAEAAIATALSGLDRYRVDSSIQT
uniref:Uncharacterized protein n=1 Tax=Peronospora matthiolae TaxID=2874970 RepID=A0AAV1VGD8_9STRA